MCLRLRMQQSDQLPGEFLADVREGRCLRTEFLLEAGDRPRESTRNDQLKMLEIRLDVQGQTVHRTPATQSNPHGTDLTIEVPAALRRHPDPGGLGIAFASDPEDRKGADHSLLEQAKIGMDAQAESVQVQDGIEDQLPGTVVGDVAATIGLGKLDAERIQTLFVHKQVFGNTRAPGDRDHWRLVLELQDPHRPVPILSSVDYRLMSGTLTGQGLGVGKPPEVLRPDVEGGWWIFLHDNTVHASRKP